MNHYYLNARYYNPENGNFLSLDAYPGDLKEPNSQNGVYIIYGATYRSGKIKEGQGTFRVLMKCDQNKDGGEL